MTRHCRAVCRVRKPRLSRRETGRVERFDRDHPAPVLVLRRSVEAASRQEPLERTALDLESLNRSRNGQPRPLNAHKPPVLLSA